MALLESKLTDDAPDRVNLLVMRAKLHLLFGNVRFMIHVREKINLMIILRPLSVSMIFRLPLN